MRLSIFIRPTALIMAGVLFCIVPCVPCSGGMVVDDSSTATTADGTDSSSSGGDDSSSINKEFALGLFIVVVAVLFWVGLKHDFGWSSRRADSEYARARSEERTFALAAELGSGEDSGGLRTSLGDGNQPQELELAGRIGMRVRF